MKDELGERMKSQYEDRYRISLPRRTYTIIRLDGKAFHTYTKNLQKPFDEDLIQDLNNTAIYLCKNIQGCNLAYIQSDEISLLLSDFNNINTQSWFDGNIQKITSVSASLATGKFNSIRFNSEREQEQLALFDSRVFVIPDREEVKNYFIWRQKDWVRNSIQLVAQSLYSHKELENKSSNELQEMIFQRGINWNNYSIYLKRGRVINYQDIEWKLDNNIPEFTQNKEFLEELIPKYN